MLDSTAAPSLLYISKKLLKPCFQHGNVHQLEIDNNIKLLQLKHVSYLHWDSCDCCWFQIKMFLSHGAKLTNQLWSFVGTDGCWEWWWALNQIYSMKLVASENDFLLPRGIYNVSNLICFNKGKICQSNLFIFSLFWGIIKKNNMQTTHPPQFLTLTLPC